MVQGTRRRSSGPDGEVREPRSEGEPFGHGWLLEEHRAGEQFSQLIEVNGASDDALHCVVLPRDSKTLIVSIIAWPIRPVPEECSFVNALVSGRHRRSPIDNSLQ